MFLWVFSGDRYDCLTSGIRVCRGTDKNFNSAKKRIYLIKLSQQFVTPGCEFSSFSKPGSQPKTGSSTQTPRRLLPSCSTWTTRWTCFAWCNTPQLAFIQHQNRDDGSMIRMFTCHRCCSQTITVTYQFDRQLLREIQPTWPPRFQASDSPSSGAWPPGFLAEPQNIDQNRWVNNPTTSKNHI